MITRVLDLDLDGPLEPLDPGAARRLFVLVRRAGRPVGVLRLKTAGQATVAALEAALAKLEVPELPAPAPARPSSVSIVVCTRDRPDELRHCLAALRPHAADGHDVIVVDNAPSDARSAEVARGERCRYVREPRAGLNHARNCGVAESRNEIVAFTDDDCRVDPGWALALSSAYDEPTVGATTGLVLPLELETPAQEQFEAYCANRRRFSPRLLRAPGTAPSTGGTAGMGANMSFRRAVLVQLGGFDPRFDGGTPTLSGGDTEMFARVLEAGHGIAYRPDALVWHRHRHDQAGLRRVIFGYGVGLFAFLTKRLVEDRDTAALSTAARWLAGPPLKALWNRLRGRPATPAALVWQELRGAFVGPLRYWAVRNQSSRAALDRPSGAVL